MCESCTQNRVKVMASNPLRLDPTRTTALRRKFEQLLRGKFNKLKQQIRELLIDDDAFGLTRNAAQNKRFEFQTTSAQVDAFEGWIKERIDRGVLDGKTRATASQGYWAAFQEDAYNRGAGRAFDDVRKPALLAGDRESVSDFFNGTKSEFLRQSFAHPVRVEKLKVLAGRVFTDLKGITEATSAQLSRQLTDGLARGENPHTIAKELTDTIDTISARRATVLARTEIIRAHAEAQLDTFEQLGVTELGVMAEWSTAGDERVCPLCQPLEGVVLKVQEARGLIPRHPQCRCAYIPANVGEPKDDKTKVNFVNPKTGEVETKDIQQKRSPLEIKRAQRQSIEAEIPKTSKRTIAQQKARSSWLGADRRISKKRPTGILSGVSETTEQKKEKQEKKRKLKETDLVAGATKLKQELLALDREAEAILDGDLPLQESLTEIERIKTKKMELRGSFQKRSLQENDRLNQTQKRLATSFDKERKEIKRKEQVVKESLDQSTQLNKRYGKKWGEYNATKKPGDPDFWETKTAIDLSKQMKDVEDKGRRAKESIEATQLAMRNKAHKFLEVPKEQRRIVNTSTNQFKSKALGTTKTTTGRWKVKLENSRDFVERMIRDTGEGPIEFHALQLTNSGRAKYNPTTKRVFTSAKNDVSVFVHEMGHAIENQTNNLTQKMKDFRERRIAEAATKPVSLKKKFPKHSFEANEIGNSDGWESLYGKGNSDAWYVGKEYDSSDTEVLSMGIQQLHKDPVGFAEKDPEFFKLIVGVLQGDL